MRASLVVDQLPIDTRAMKHLTVLRDAVAVFSRAAMPALTVTALPVGAEAEFSNRLASASEPVRDWMTAAARTAGCNAEALSWTAASRVFDQDGRPTVGVGELPAAVA